ncbi:GrpB family protein, partial [Microbacteriaceae bacterium 4G12]
MTEGLRASDEILPQAERILGEQRDALRAAGVPGDLVLLGGSSVAGALTRGDVDLHLRVPAADFPAAVEALRRSHAVVHPEIWGPTLAAFEAVGTALPTGIAVTPVGSEHDQRFTRTWALLRADPALVQEYNAAKLAEDGPGGEGYEDRKSAFFDRVLRLWGGG